MANSYIFNVFLGLSTLNEQISIMICLKRRDGIDMSLKRIFSKKVFKIFLPLTELTEIPEITPDGLSTSPLTFHYSYPFHWSNIVH